MRGPCQDLNALQAHCMQHVTQGMTSLMPITICTSDHDRASALSSSVSSSVHLHKHTCRYRAANITSVYDVLARSWLEPLPSSSQDHHVLLQHTTLPEQSSSLPGCQKICSDCNSHQCGACMCRSCLLGIISRSYPRLSARLDRISVTDSCSEAAYKQGTQREPPTLSKP